MENMNLGALSPLEPKPVTFMEETISNMSKVSEGLDNANIRLGSLLIRLRGSQQETNPDRKEPSLNCHVEAVKTQLNLQNIEINRLHNMLDELMKLM